MHAHPCQPLQHDGAFALQVARDDRLGDRPEARGLGLDDIGQQRSRSVTKITAWRLAMRCRLSSSSPAVVVSMNSVNSTTSARRFRRVFSSARPRVKLVSSAR